MYFLNSGTIEVYTKDGFSKLLREPGDFFGKTRRLRDLLTVRDGVDTTRYSHLLRCNACSLIRRRGTAQSQ